jgi:dihydrofolate reductase
LTWASSLGDALGKVKTEEQKIFIVGGATLYQEALAIADTLDLTLIDGEFDGDTFFPEYATLLGDEFKLAQRETHTGYRFDTYRRTKAANRQPAATPALQTVG